ncbi:MAG: transglutaminase domain-containing protein, partial [Chloroflexi bacterium]|nr:transglutaminase domain-containing protein [Chloroflexota bacterium]
VFLVFLLTRPRLPAILLHIIGLPLMAGGIFLQTLRLAEGRGIAERYSDVVSRASAWWEAARNGDITSDTLPFMFLLIALTWLIGYIAGWSALRHRNFWFAVLPPAIAAIVNLSYLPARFDTFFAMFLVFSFLLASHLNAVRSRSQWQRDHINYPTGLTGSTLGKAFWLALIALGVAWLLPLSGTIGLLNRGVDSINGPWDRAQQHANRLFTAATTRKGGALRGFSSTLPFRTASSAGDTIAFTVTTDFPYYWRATSYDIYAGQGWKNSGQVERPLGWEPPGVPFTDYAYRTEVTQIIQLEFQTDILLMAGQPASADVSAAAETARRDTISIPIAGGPTQALPPDLLPVVGSLRRLLSGPRPLSREEIFSFLPPDLQGEKVQTSGLSVTAVEVSRKEPNPIDVITLRSESKLRKGSSYTGISTVSIAPAKALASAGNNYPGWVKDRYLQLPDGLPGRVRELAIKLASGKGNAFDRAQAIHDYLRSIPYDKGISPPPFEHDGIDWFLFDAQKGYADYYASAMVVMLRSIGIPARLAAGYYTGEYDQERNLYVVKSYHALTWPEVFFPSFGWVEFNPNPKYPPIERPELTDAEGLAQGMDEELMGPLEDMFPPFEPDVPLQEGDQSSSGAGGGKGWLWLLLIPGIMAALLLAAYLIWRRSLSGLRYPVQVYEEMCRLAGFVGIGPKPHQTPREYTQTLSSLLPDSSRDIGEIGGSYAKIRFARGDTSPEEERGLKEAWEALRSRLLWRILPWKR